MEWVETTGRTIEEAKSAALDQLGVVEDDAEFEIVEEPRVGLFGRQRGEARVRARIRPTIPRPKVERRDRKKRGDSAAAAAPAEGDRQSAERAPKAAPSRSRTKSGGNGQQKQRQTGAGENAAAAPNTEPRTKENDVSAQQVADEATTFINGLVSAFGLSGTTAAAVEGDEIEVTVDGADLGLLVGPRGSTLQAVQELTRVVAQRRLGDHDTHLRVDVGGYRERRREALGRFAEQVADQVIADGVARSLEPMSSADRKIVHDVLAGVSGVATSSAGEEPHRRVVISPAHG